MDINWWIIFLHVVIVGFPLAAFYAWYQSGKTIQRIEGFPLLAISALVIAGGLELIKIEQARQKEAKAQVQKIEHSNTTTPARN